MLGEAAHQRGIKSYAVGFSIKQLFAMEETWPHIFSSFSPALPPIFLEISILAGKLGCRRYLHVNFAPNELFFYKSSQWFAGLKWSSPSSELLGSQVCRENPQTFCFIRNTAGDPSFRKSMCQSFVAAPGGLSVTSHQCCGPRRESIITFVHIPSILLCIHWLPATARELLWSMVSCCFSREGPLDLKDLSSPGDLFCSLVCNLRCEHHSSELIAGWKAHKEQER